MKKMIKAMVFGAVMFSASFGLNSDKSIPENLHVYDTHGNTYVDVAFSGHTRRVYIERNHISYDAIFSLLLSAQINQAKVQIISNRYTPQGSPILDGATLVK